MREIFSRLVNAFDGNPFTLLLVSKYWRTVAESMEGLWTNIGLLLAIPLSRSTMSHFDSRRDSMVLCASASGLMRAIHRVKHVGFTFRCVVPPHSVTVRKRLSIRGPSGTDVLWMSFDKRLFAQHCRRLVLDSDFLQQQGVASNLGFNNESSSSSTLEYPQLEELSFSGVLCNSMLAFLQSLESQAPNLRSLTIDFASIAGLLSLHAFLGRPHLVDVSSNRLPADELVSLVPRLDNVRILRLRGDGQFLRLSPSPSCRLQELSLTALSISCFPETIFRRLVRLELVDNPHRPSSSFINSGMNRMRMPSLEVLSIDGSWSDLASIDAPKLVSLTVRCPTDERQIWRNALRGCSLRPKWALTIDEAISEFDLEFKFGEGEAWSQIRSLNVVCRGQTPRFFSALAGLLKIRRRRRKGKKKQASSENDDVDNDEKEETFLLCTQLQCLTVQLDDGILFHSNRLAGGEWVYPSLQYCEEELREIIRERSSLQSPLTSVCLGWMGIQSPHSKCRELVWKELVD
ncbi:hypothetical protein FRC17_007724 [Serendipita sp. 399]|nr:hypothetical protein FRC17_007724 [Serendipita sp. 399]